MRIQYKIGLLLSSIFGILILTFLSYQYIQLYQKKLIHLENAKNQEIVIDKVLQLNRIKYEQLINDNSGWDEMVSFVSNPDKEWAKDNVDFFVNSFKLSFVLVYDKDRKLVYEFRDPACLKSLARPDELLIKSLFKEVVFPRYFQYGGNQLFEIFGAPIVPAFDTDTRKTPPQGYLFIGKIWDKEYLEQHAQTTSYHTELFPIAQIREFKKDKKKIYSTRDLLDPTGRPIARLAFSKIDTIRHDLTIFLYISLFFTFISVAAMIILFGYLRKMVLVPIAQIKQTLDTHNPEYISSFKNRTDELKRLGDLIGNSFEQEELLKSKNAELLDTNATKDKLFSIIAHD